MRENTRFAFLIVCNVMLYGFVMLWFSQHGINISEAMLFDVLSENPGNAGFVFGGYLVGAFLVNYLIIGWPSEEKVLAMRLINAHIRGIENASKPSLKRSKHKKHT